MERFEKQRRLRTLKKQLELRAKQVTRHLEDNPHLKFEKIIKKELAVTVKRFVNQEIVKSSIKTYDWYFDDTLHRLYRQRNNLAKNRYFIVDTIEVDIGGTTPSYYGQQRVRELPITDAEIKKRISSSAAIFAKMLKVTVSKEEKTKIWNAYDTVDEKTIFIVTLGIPIAIIGGIELFPLLAAEAELVGSSATYLKSLVTAPNLGLSLNSSIRSSLGYSFADATAQYVGSGFNYKKVDPYKAMVSGVFKFSPSSVFMRSAVNSSIDNDYKLKFSPFDNIAVDFSFGMLGGKVNGNIGSFGLTEFNKSMGGFLTHTMRIGVNSTKTAVTRKAKEELKNEENNK